MSDHELLRKYVECHSEEAFRILVERHLGMVHGLARRQLHRVDLAEEVVQGVFIALAQKAVALSRDTVIAGWLFRATRFAAAKVLREEERRQKRERVAVAIQTVMNETDTHAIWEQVEPFLNDGLEALIAKDRDAVLLRYFENRSFQEIAATLNITEEASKKRVQRALEKLRCYFQRRGLALPSTILGTVLTTHAAVAAPPTLMAAATGVALQGAAGTASTFILAKGILELMAWTKAKTVAVGSVAALLVVGTATLLLKDGTIRTQSLGTITNPPSLNPLATPAAKPTTIQRLDWRQVESPDYRQYIANMRTIGMPEKTIRDIIVADGNQLFKTRLETIRAGAKKRERWQLESFGHGDETTVKQVVELTREKHKLLKLLLGTDVGVVNDLEENLKPVTGPMAFLPLEKQILVQKIKDKAAEQIKKLDQQLQAQGLTGTERDLAMVKQIASIQLQQEAELGGALSPGEKEEYDLQFSNIAHRFCVTLSAFNPTEQEYREIFKIQKAFEDEQQATRSITGLWTGFSPEESFAREQAMDQEIRAVLGAKRFKDYERANDQIYQLASEFSRTKKLPEDTADRIYVIRNKVADQYIQRIVQPGLNGEQRQTALRDLYAEAQRQLTEILGEDNLAAYQETQLRHGYWVDDILRGNIPKKYGWQP